MKDSKATIAKWVDTWEKAHIELTSIKYIEMSKENYIVDSLTSLTDLFNLTLANSKPSQSSGLIEMQRYFAMLRPKDD
jgi:hypothetical protein